MHKIRLLLLLFCLLGVITLQAQTVSQLDFLRDTIPTEYFQYVTTWSDNLLHFYRIEFNNIGFNVKHWTCAPSGIQTYPYTIYTCVGDFSYLLYNPDYKKEYNRLYISLTTQSSYHLLTITPDGEVRYNILPVKSYTLFSPDYLYYIHSDFPSNISVWRYNLETNQTDSLFDWPNFEQVYIGKLTDSYLLIYGSYLGSQNGIVVVDTSFVNHSGNYSGYPLASGPIDHVSQILPDVFLAGIGEGLTGEYDYGIFTLNGYNLDFSLIGYYFLGNFDEYIYSGIFFYYVLSYGDGRFTCFENNHELNWVGYNNFTYNGTLIPDSNFPNLTQYTYPIYLGRVNDRYAVAVTPPSNSTRRFICIDYQLQTITDTLVNLVYDPPISHRGTYLTDNYVYYLYSADGIKHVLILKINEYTDNSDLVQSPPSFSARAFPNPFKDNATIRVYLKKPEQLTVSIYNLKGQLVRTLVSEDKAELTYELIWDGTNNHGTKTADGLYLYEIKTSSGLQVKGKLFQVK